MKFINTFIILSLSLAVCAQPINTDRPDQTESSATLSSNELQIESGILVEFTENDLERTERQILAPTNLLRYGITNGIELRFVSQYESIRDQQSEKSISGMSDLQIGTKIQLLQKDDINAEIALLSHLILPTGTKGLTLDKYGTINRILISHELSNDLSLGYNLGYNYFGEGNGDFTYTIALGKPVNQKVGIYIEAYGDLVEMDEHLASFDAGFTYLPEETVQLDFSFGTGINYNMNYISVGCSWLMR